MVLGDPPAAEQAGLARVAGPGVDLHRHGPSTSRAAITAFSRGCKAGEPRKKAAEHSPALHSVTGLAHPHLQALVPQQHPVSQQPLVQPQLASAIGSSLAGMPATPKLRPEAVTVKNPTLPEGPGHMTPPIIFIHSTACPGTPVVHAGADVAEQELKDISIIGGGPTGLFAAFYAGMRGASARIIDALPALGGQLMALYPEKYIFDVAGFPKVLAKDLVRDMAAQGLQFGATTHLGEIVTGLRRVEDGNGGHFVLETDGGDYPSRTIVIAAGIGAFEARRLGIEGEDAFEEKGLYFKVLDPKAVRGPAGAAGRRRRLGLRLGGEPAGRRQVDHADPPARRLPRARRDDQPGAGAAAARAGATCGRSGR